jgi:serine-type D-Ala-D-Ala carboxypeptidase/endopeptidase (penicillin-binding protein 4)
VDGDSHGGPRPVAGAAGRRRSTLLTAALVLAAVSLAAVGAAGVVVWQRSSGEAETGAPWETPTAVPAAAALPPVPAGGATPGGLTAEDAVARALEPALSDPALGDRPGVSVLDAGGGEVFSRAATEPVTPASTLKVLTAASVLAAVGPDARFPTTVVTGEQPGEVVLVGGGDPGLTRRPAPGEGRGGGQGGHSGAGPSGADALLPGTDTGPARLPDLAAATARALRARGTTSVRLDVDDSRFSGPTVSPSWPEGYVSGGYVAPVTALAADAGRVEPGGTAREDDPSLAAGRLFADLLEKRGLEVRGDVSRRDAPEGADVVARTQSAPVASLVETMLQESDNDYAEVLLRQAARATGHPATFAGGAEAVAQVLGESGIDASGLVMHDGSGLSREDRVPPRVLTEVLAAAAQGQRRDLRPLVTALPVAGLTGTLDDRFSAGGDTAGLGTVRAKTGTLTGVGGLAGVVQDADGDLLVFALLTDEGTSQQGVEAALDEAASALASCGCAGVVTPSPSPSETAS